MLRRRCPVHASHAVQAIRMQTIPYDRHTAKLGIEQVKLRQASWAGWRIDPSKAEP
jgi:hypothetical protein